MLRAPFNVTAFVPRRRLRRGVSCTPDDIQQWWLQPDEYALRDQAPIGKPYDEISLAAMPMFGLVLARMAEDQQAVLRERLQDWVASGLPDRDGMPLFGLLVDRDSRAIRCTAGHHPTHQMFNGYSPFFACSPTPIRNLDELQQTIIATLDPHALTPTVTRAPSPQENRPMATPNIIRDHQSWSKTLADGFRARRSPASQLTRYGRIGLPASRDDKASLCLEGPPSSVRMSLNADAVIANMQTDHAAFEAWALALWAWTDATRIVLDWKTPDRTEDGHYQRFLFRAQCFRDLFPDRFSLARNESHRPFDRITSVDRAGADSPSANASHREARLERRLVQEKWPKHKDGMLESSQQMPVGTFNGSVSKATAVFTGGKSAIDLVGWNEVGKKKTFAIYELKAGNNTPLGIVSELLFYIHLLRWVRQTKPGADLRVQGYRPGLQPYNALLDCTHLEGVFLAPRFHPLLVPIVSDTNASCPMIKLLNEAWTARGGIPQVSLRWRQVDPALDPSTDPSQRT